MDFLQVQRFSFISKRNPIILCQPKLPKNSTLNLKYSMIWCELNTREQLNTRSREHKGCCDKCKSTYPTLLKMTDSSLLVSCKHVIRAYSASNVDLTVFN